MTGVQTCALRSELTTDKDRELIGTNKADVRYKIIFNKRRVKVPERAAVKEASIAGQLHPTAFNAAWALDRPYVWEPI